MLATQLAVVLSLAAAPAFAQLATFRGTIPGSLHQCENTTMDFFDSGATRPLSVLFLPSNRVPAALLTGTTTLAVAQQYSPLFALSGIVTPDASAYPFILQLAVGAVVEVFAFLPDGTGKNLNLPKTIQTPLPSATACLTNIPTTVGGAAGGAGTVSSASAATATGSSKASSRASASGSSATSARTSTSASSSAAAPSSSASTAGAGALAVSGAAALVGLAAGAFML